MPEIPPELAAKLEEDRHMGWVVSSDWADYVWKNELKLQCDRVLEHLHEILSEVETDHAPNHMLERALGIAALSMRRLIETHSVTDKFRDRHQNFHQVPRKETQFRPHFLGQTGRYFYHNYDLEKLNRVSLLPLHVASKLIHAQTIGVIRQSAYIPDGLLIASDYQQRQALFHFTSDQFRAFCYSFLDDRVVTSFESWDPETGKAFAKRLGPGDTE